MRLQNVTPVVDPADCVGVSVAYALPQGWSQVGAVPSGVLANVAREATVPGHRRPRLPGTRRCPTEATRPTEPTVHAPGHVKASTYRHEQSHDPGVLG